ncbi:hypothetical protein GIB67_032155, partial [Kingdonia uniflora]
MRKAHETVLVTIKITYFKHKPFSPTNLGTTLSWCNLLYRGSNTPAVKYSFNKLRIC